MNKWLRFTVLTCIALLVSAGAVSADEPTPPDPTSNLNRALDNLSTAPKLTSRLVIDSGVLPIRATLIVNAPKRFSYQRVSAFGITLRTLSTAYLEFERGNRRCWSKRRKRLDLEALFAEMKTNNTAVEQTAADAVSFTHAQDRVSYRVAMRYDPATLMPLELTGTLLDGGPTQDAFPSYRMTFAYSAINRVPRHSPICKQHRR